MKPDQILQTISVQHELSELGIKFTLQGENEAAIICPFHNESTPSCYVNTETKLFKCHSASCYKDGDFITLLAGIRKLPRNIVVVELINRYQLDDVKEIPFSTVENYHEEIWKITNLLKELYARGVSDEDIRQHRLGVHEGRITIPIFNHHAAVVNVRRYLPGAPPNLKMRNTKGRGQNRLFPIFQPDKYDPIVICGGEIKAIVTASKLNPFGIGAVTTTSGEGSWNETFTSRFKDKRVYVCFDIDKGGIEASEKICRLLYRVAKQVYKTGRDPGVAEPLPPSGWGGTVSAAAGAARAGPCQPGCQPQSQTARDRPATPIVGPVQPTLNGRPSWKLTCCWKVI